MARRNSRSKAKNTIKVDFTGVESSGKVAEGRMIAEVVECEVKESESSGNEYINWKLKAKGGNVYHTTSLQPHALWNLRNTLEAMGLEVPDSALDLDLSEYPGMELGIEVEHEVYQGKKRPRIIDVFPVDELDGEEAEEEEEEEKPAKKSTSKKKGEPEEGEESDLTYDEVMGMDKDELLELAEEEEIKVPAKTKRKLETLREFIASELGLEGEEEEEEPEEEEKPTRRSRRKTGTKELVKGAEVEFEDDGEDIEGTVISVNQKEGFAVIDVDGEEWEVELEDIKVK